MKRRDLSVTRPPKPAASIEDKSEKSLPAPSRKHYRWAGHLLHHVHESASKRYEQSMRTIGLRPAQVGILQLLAAEGPLVQARLGDKLGLDKATIVPNVNELEEAGLVERRNHPGDGRAFIVHLKAAGVARLKAAEKINREVSETLFRALTETERKELVALLRKIDDDL